MARSTARRRALNTLYEADEKGQDILSLLSERIAMPGAQTPLPDYAIEIVRGVAEHRREIDHTLDAHSTGWKVRRMGVVDRNILRIAAWEILFNDDVPDRVAIDEALSLARTLCDDNALPFIQGLLSAVCEAKDAAEQNESDESDEVAETTEAVETAETTEATEEAEVVEVVEVADSAEAVNGGDTEQDDAGSATESADSATEPVSDSDFVTESFVDSDTEVSAEEEAPAEAVAETNDGETAATSEDSSSAAEATDLSEEDSSPSEQPGESVESA